MATFAKPENALKRAEGESLGLGSISSVDADCCCRGSLAAMPTASRVRYALANYDSHNMKRFMYLVPCSG